MALVDELIAGSPPNSSDWLCTHVEGAAHSQLFRSASKAREGVCRIGLRSFGGLPRVSASITCCSAIRCSASVAGIAGHAAYRWLNLRCVSAQHEALRTVPLSNKVSNLAYTSASNTPSNLIRWDCGCIHFLKGPFLRIIT